MHLWYTLGAMWTGMRCGAVILFLAFGTAANADRPSCLSAQTCFEQALMHKAAGRHDEARALWEALLENYPGSLWSQRAAVLLARSYQEAGDPKASVWLLKALHELPAVADYTLFSLAEFYAGRQDWNRAARVMEELIRDHPDSLLRPSSLFRAGEFCLQGGEFSCARQAFRKFLDDYPDHSLVPHVLLRLSESYFREQQFREFASVARRLWSHYPETPQAQDVEERLRALPAMSYALPEPSPEEKYLRAKNLFFARRYDTALSEFSEVVHILPEGPSQEDSILKMGIALYQLKRFVEAKEALESLFKDPEKRIRLPDVVTWLGKTYLKLDEEASLLALEKEISRPPFHPERVRTLLLVADFYESKTEDAEAEERYRRIMTEHPRDPAAEEARWRLGWFLFKGGKYGEAVAWFSRSLESYPASPLLPQVLYWKGRGLEKMDKWEEAARVYVTLCRKTRHSYYCHNGEKRLQTLSQRVGGKYFVIGSEGESPVYQEKDPPSEDIHYRKAQELMIMGFHREAAGELNLLVSRYPDKGVLLRLNTMLSAVGDHHRSLRNAQLRFSEELLRGAADLPRPVWEQAFPRGFNDLLVKASFTVGLDPLLVAAVIREESLFDPLAVSRSGAIGLMQLLPATAEDVARRIGMSSYRSDSLYDRDVNIQLGATYLSSLLERFKGNVAVSLASYNAGPTAVSSWLTEGNTQADAQNMDEFVESIPYPETRFYVKRIMRSYVEYVRLYGSSPSP